ncbi:unnamed protein product [Alopecurus aequalis]
MEALASAVHKMVKDQLVSAITLQLGLSGDLWEIKTKLEGMEVMITGTEKWSTREERKFLWLERVKDATYHISDLIYEYEENTRPGTRKFHCLPNGPKTTLANMMKKAKDQLNNISAEFFGAQANYIPQRVGVREISDIPQRLTQKERELMVLMGPSPGSIILPIYGVEGVGKKILAKMVYNNAQFKNYSRAWVPVSPPFDLEKIGISIISQVSENECGSVEMGVIRGRLQEILAGKRIFIVLDNLCEDEASKLEDLKFMLMPNLGKGGKVVVIVTTHNETIARKICTIAPYRLSHLTEDNMCWEIIKQRSDFELRDNKEQLEQIGRQIAVQCVGVALLAQSCGHSLKLMTTPVQWKAEGDRIIWNSSDSEEERSGQLLAYLMLSYNDLPPYLKLCFAYCAILPRGCSIVKQDLIHQWIALGFIPPSSTSKSEACISQLFERSFLQYAEPHSTSGPGDKGAILYTMHVLSHDLARSVMNRDLVVLDVNGTTSENKYCRYALLNCCDGRLLKLSSICPATSKIRALHCNAVELSDDSYLFARCVRVLKLNESSMQKLPDSVCQLRHLRYLNLSGCSRLATLPESFGDLVNLLHINLSGCSSLVTLPESFGDLVNLLHINLSGCSRLATLPEYFGDLVNLLHINLSACSRLAKLPESFGKLKKLVYLDLSFLYCFEGILEVLGGLTSLQHLNLAHPCCSRAEHWTALEGLAGVLAKLTQLQYLNLSMFLNNILYYQPEMTFIHYIGSCISGLPCLEHLDLSHNIFLTHLPPSLCDLKKLHTLDLSGCTRLDTIPKSSVKSIVPKNFLAVESYQFVARGEELDISRLEYMQPLKEAQLIRLVEKQNVKTLKLRWTVGAAQGSVVVHEDALLGELVPPLSLHCLELHGYRSEMCKPAWWEPNILPNLIEVTIQDFPRCTVLPPFGLLPKLQRLVLRRMARIEQINDGVLGYDQRTSNQLSKVTIDDMENLKVFTFPGVAVLVNQKFPVLPELVIQKCPKLIFGPLPPRAQRLVISNCNNVMTSWRNRKEHSGKRSSSSTPVTELVVESYNLPLGDSSLLHHLPGLRSLTFKNCGDLTASSTEIIQALSSLETLCFSHCEGMISLPGNFGDLTSLKELTIQSCHAMISLLESMHNLTSLKDLYILDCPELKRWCESEENMMYLTRIRPKYEKPGASSTA